MFDADESFCAYIVGKRNSGKSYLLMQLLLSKDGFKDKFDRIYLINPTYQYDLKYQTIKFTQVYENFTNELIEELIKEFEKNEEDERILLILDDCVCEDNFKKNQSDTPLNRLAVNGRHWGVSLVILSQKYNAISSYIRSQLDYIVLFETKNQTELKTLYEEFGFGSFKSYMKFLHKVYTDKHDIMIIDNINNRHLKNFIPLNNINDSDSSSEHSD